MKTVTSCLLGAVALATAGISAQPSAETSVQTLDIYFIDVEGGQSTLIVTPQKQALLVDTGFPGSGVPPYGKVGLAQARDANRIAAAARDAGVRQIDYLLVTHFHSDHMGGAAELAQLLPILTFVDHGQLLYAADKTPATLQIFDTYAAARQQGRHMEAKPGDKLKLQGVDVTVVSSAEQVLAKPLRGAGKQNTACGKPLPAGAPNDNARSTGIAVQFGKFRFLDLGDLTAKPLFDLACPLDKIGPIDAYLVAHHGGADAAEPATFAAFKPRVAIVNNGATKGGAPALLNHLRQVAGLQDVWQLHRAQAAGAANFPDRTVANLDESTAHWLKLSASDDGSFRMQNGRTGQWVDY
jgi:competence protein ComEC